MVQFPSELEIEASRKAGFSRLWMVDGDYEIHDGFLYCVNPGTRFIAPAGSPQLMAEFGKLHDGNLAAVIRFARTWGMLGWWQLATHQQIDPTPIDELAEVGRHPDGRAGEPLSWIWAHARGIRLCLEILKYLHDDDTAGLDRYLDSLRRPVTADSTLRLPHLVYGNGHRIWQGALLADETATETGWHIIKMITNANLVGIHHELEDADGGGVQLTRGFRGLTDVAYWQLADLAQNVSQVSVCAECGSVFRQEDRRQRFCPPARWEDGLTGETPGTDGEYLREEGPNAAPAHEPFPAKASVDQ